MAHPLGFYSKQGLNVEVTKTAGWALIRDKMINKEYDASHFLSPMPLAISMGIAWLVIVAAEMLVGGTGIGYFVWNEWNNLSLVNVIFAVLVIGVVGMLLDMAFAKLQKGVTYVE